MSLRQTILERLAASQNLAVEHVIEAALAANPSAHEQQEFLDLLITRNKRAGWITLIKSFHRFSEEARAAIIDRRQELFGPLSEAMQDFEGPARSNVIDIVQRSQDPHLTYLLAQMLMDSRPEIRDRAGKSFLAAILQSRQLAAVAVSGDTPFDPKAAAEIRRSVEFSLRQYKTHKQQVGLLAAFIVERQQDAPMWAYFIDPHEDISKSAAALLRNPPAAVAPHLAAATLLALASPLKPAAVAGFSSTEEPAAGRALARESFRLLDPILRAVAQNIGHLKILPVLWDESPPDSQTWAQWLRLVQAAGLQLVEKISWLTRLLEKAIASQDSAVAWKLCVLQAFAEYPTYDAGRLFARVLTDADERVARFAARLLLSRKRPEWRNLAAGILIPHRSVRRMMGVQNAPGRANAAPGNERPSPAPQPAVDGAPAPAFGNVWGKYSQLPPAVQHSVSRTAAAEDPLFPEQMKAKLSSKLTADLAQGLKMIAVLPNLAPYRAQIIGLCGHADGRVAGTAVKLVGRLEDPRLKDLLEAAALHTDPRVRANAVESMAALHIANRSQQVLAMLNSRHNRERANAIKAISEFDFNTARECLQRMLADPNPMHRISALWVVQQLAFPEIYRQISSTARKDPNLRVRKRAADMLETLTGTVPAETARR